MAWLAEAPSTVGDRVIIGAEAKVLGPIGEDSGSAPMPWSTRPAERAVVVGVPGQVIGQSQSAARLIGAARCVDQPRFAATRVARLEAVAARKQQSHPATRSRDMATGLLDLRQYPAADNAFFAAPPATRIIGCFSPRTGFPSRRIHLGPEDEFARASAAETGRYKRGLRIRPLCDAVCPTQAWNCSKHERSY